MSEWQEYRIVITAPAAKHLRQLAKKLGKPLFAQLKEAILDLSHNPAGKTQELAGKLAPYRSLHVSRCRVIVKIDNTYVKVYVVAAGWHTSRDRDDIYEEVSRMIDRESDLTDNVDLDDADTD